MPNRNRRRIHFPVFPFLIIAGGLFFGFLVMILWNAIVSPVLHTGVLSYWQAVGLLVLCRILTGGFRGGPPSGRGRQWRGGVPPWKQKWMNMTEEERANFREEWKKKCGPRGGTGL